LAYGSAQIKFSGKKMIKSEKKKEKNIEDTVLFDAQNYFEIK
jgi:hypothetical protein